jgi:hypothetical protein
MIGPDVPCSTAPLDRPSRLIGLVEGVIDKVTHPIAG